MIRVKTQKPIATITLSKPEKLNRMSTQDMDKLSAQLKKIDADPSVQVIVVTGAGREAFCAGADISEFPESGLMAQRRQAEAFQQLCLTLYALRTPLLAKVNGVAVGGGMAMVSLAHIAVASENARFGTPEIRVGAFPNMVMAAVLRSIPRKLAVKMILMGEMVSAQEALSMGLVNQVVPPDQLDEAARDIAGKLADKSAAVMMLGLDSIRVSSELPYPQALEYLKEVGTLIRQTEDFKEGSRAFLEKRKPKWKGL